jgi:hypothetical protein
MSAKKLSVSKQDKALALVAGWLGPRMGYDGPAPTGREEAYRAQGPMLEREWDGRPAVILEGGPYDWAIEAGSELADQFSAIGVFAEPYSGWALCLYPAEPTGDEYIRRYRQQSRALPLDDSPF